MRNNKALLISILLVIFFVVYLSSHTNIAQHNSGVLLPIYALNNNNKAELLYHVDSGVVYIKDSKGLHSFYAHAHIICSTFPPHGTVLGYIIKNDVCPSPSYYYVYIEPNKIKKIP